MEEEKEKKFDFQPKGEFQEEYYSNGNLKSVTEIKGGKADGLHKEFYESGEFFGGGKFKNGKAEGEWKSYHENGEIKSKRTYKEARY